MINNCSDEDDDLEDIPLDDSNNKDCKIDTSCNLLGIGLKSVILIENLNDIIPPEKVIMIKKEMLGGFYYIPNINFKKVIYKCIIKKKSINKLFMSCVKNCSTTKIFIDQWIYDYHIKLDDHIYTTKKIKDFNPKEIKSIITIMNFYKNKPFYNLISIGMGLGYHYNQIRQIKDAYSLIKIIIKDNISINKLYEVANSLGFYTLTDFLKKNTPY